MLAQFLRMTTSYAALFVGAPSPGGATDVILLEDAASGILLEDGTSFFQLE
jgi:hypothetical protein